MNLKIRNVTVDVSGTRASGKSFITTAIEDCLTGFGLTVFRDEDIIRVTGEVIEEDSVAKGEVGIDSLANLEPRNILQDAAAVIYGDREQTYGNPAKNLDLIAAYWTAHINSKFGQNITLTSQDVCGMMILLKQARLANNPGHIDSLVDICGYAALDERIQTGK